MSPATTITTRTMTGTTMSKGAFHGHSRPSFLRLPAPSTSPAVRLTSKRDVIPMSRSGDPTSPDADHLQSTAPDRVALRAAAEREAEAFLLEDTSVDAATAAPMDTSTAASSTAGTLSSYGTLAPAIATLQRVRDHLAELEPASKVALQRAQAAALSATFYDGARALWSTLQLARPTWLEVRRKALNVEGAWLNSVTPDELAARAREQGIAHDPQALQVLPNLAYTAVQARERLKAFQQLRIDLVRKIYRANPATLTNPTGLSHRDLAQWSGLTPMRVSQLLSDVYRTKQAAADPTRGPTGGTVDDSTPDTAAGEVTGNVTSDVIGDIARTGGKS